MARSPLPTYPPPPWRLRGHGFAAGWLARDPGVTIPEGWKPLSVGGRRLIGGVWAEYAVGGDLAYSELAIGVIVRKGGALAITIPWIWVDSRASMTGARRLWGIPKQLAAFHREGEVRTAVTPLGSAQLVTGRTGRAFGRRSFGFAAAQPDGARCILTPARLTADIRPCPSSWRLPVDLPSRPLIAFELEDLELVFGE